MSTPLSLGIADKFNILLKYCIEENSNLDKVIDCMNTLKIGFDIKNEDESWNELLKKLDVNRCSMCKSVSPDVKTVGGICSSCSTILEIDKLQKEVETWKSKKEPNLARMVVYNSNLYDTLKKNIQEWNNWNTGIIRHLNEGTYGADDFHVVEYLKFIQDKLVTLFGNAIAKRSEQDMADVVLLWYDLKKNVNDILNERKFSNHNFISVNLPKSWYDPSETLEISTKLWDELSGISTILMLDKDNFEDTVDQYWLRGKYRPPEPEYPNEEFE